MGSIKNSPGLRRQITRSSLSTKTDSKTSTSRATRLSKSNPRVVIVDDHEVMRSAICLALHKAFEKSPDAQLNTLGELHEELERSGADLVILDLMLGEEDIRPHIPKLVVDFPKTRFLILSALTNLPQITKVIRSGIHGFVHKTHGLDVLAKAIQDVWVKSHFLCARATAAMMNSIKTDQADVDSGSTLTKRESQLLRVLAAGTNIKKAAETLGISEKTIYTHRASLFKKTGTLDNVGLVCYSIRRGLIESPH